MAAYGTRPLCFYYPVTPVGPCRPAGFRNRALVGVVGLRSAPDEGSAEPPCSALPGPTGLEGSSRRH